jgi:hypothetical protein
MIVSNDYNQSIAKVQESRSRCASLIQHREIQSIEMHGPFLGRKDHDHAPKIRLHWYRLLIALAALAMFCLWYRYGHIYFFKRETKLERIRQYVLSWFG